MKLRKRSGLAALVVALIAAGAMTVCFALSEGSYEKLSSLPASSVVTGQGHAQREGQININTATESELDTLPGIGKVKAAAIVAWRTEHGPFRYPEELILVPGIGEGTLSKVLDQITAGGD